MVKTAEEKISTKDNKIKTLTKEVEEMQEAL